MDDMQADYSTHTWASKWQGLSWQWPVTVRPSKGTRSLVTICLETICQNSNSLPRFDPSGNLALTWYMKKVFELLANQYGFTFQAWKNLLPVLQLMKPDYIPMDGWLPYFHSCSSTGPFSIIQQQLTSPSVEWIAHLLISCGTNMTEEDFMSLSKMPNLGVLEFHRAWSGPSEVAPLMDITDSLWRKVTDNRPNPFPMLRVLKLTGEMSVTNRCLEDLALLPSLVFIWACTDPYRGGGSLVKPQIAPQPWWEYKEDTSITAGSVCYSSFSDMELSSYWRKLDSSFSSVIYPSNGRVYHSTHDSGLAEETPTLIKAWEEFQKEEHAPSLYRGIHEEQYCHKCYGYQSRWGAMAYTTSGELNTMNEDIKRAHPEFGFTKESVYTMCDDIKVSLPPRPFITVHTGSAQEPKRLPVSTMLYRRKFSSIEDHRQSIRDEREGRSPSVGSA